MHQILKNLSLRRKLTLAFGTIILFCTVAAIIGAWGIGSVFTKSRTLYRDFGQSQGMVNRILADFKQNELLISTLLINNDPQGRETLLAALEENQQTLQSSFSESSDLGYLDSLSAEDLRELESLLEQYFSIQKQVVELSAHSPEQAIPLFTQELMVQGEQVDTIIQQVISAHAQAGEQMLQELGSNTLRVMIALGVFLLFSLLYSGVISHNMSASIGKSVQGLLTGMEHLGAGQLGTRVDVLSQDDLGRISQMFNSTCETLDTYVSHVNEIMSQVATGRLVYDDPVAFQGDFLTMQQSILSMVQQENQLIRLVRDTTEQVTMAAEQVSVSSQSLAQSSAEQAGSVQQLSASLAEFAQNMSTAVEDAGTTSQQTQQAGELTHLTDEKMEQMLKAMDEIGAASQEMGKIVKSIDSIAFQTNLLALNAAVEAARAGSAEKGFAVIADTVRQLAIKSSEEAQETARLLQSTLEAVATGKQLAADAADLLRNTSAASSQSVQATAKVLDTLTNQFSALEQLHAALEQINAAIQTNSASAEKSAAASQQLHAQSSALEQHVSVFTLN